MIGVRVAGDDLKGLGDELIGELREWAYHAVHDGGRMLQGEIVRTLRSSKSRSGVAYQVSRTGQLHIASAAGEPPAVLTGRLANSIAAASPVWEGDTVTSEVGTNVEYAARLEYGFRGRDTQGRMYYTAPRPYMQPAVRKAAPAINARLERG
jgi:phage gpG-like protein